MTTQHHKAEQKKFMVNGSHTSIHVLEDLVQQQPHPSPCFNSYSTQWPMDTAPLLTYYAKLMKTGPIHTHIPDTDPLTIPSFQVIGHKKQFLGLNQCHLPPQPPTTYKAASTNYKPSNNDNNYSHPLGKSFVILLVKRLY
jgi:hypothetical protein